ncbi:MAG: hypothetical protein IPJ76_18945 [Flavobacteriales bacterium]|nr:MAG: hypothetical protein IPJ76_18945 [Flavobacteriales bacterium]
MDEAHSSQSGDAAKELKAIRGAGTAEEGEDISSEDVLTKVMSARGKQKN